MYSMLYYSSRVIIIDRRSEMKGSEAKMLGFMEGADKRYIIPVYQRKYDWQTSAVYRFDSR